MPLLAITSEGDGEESRAQEALAARYGAVSLEQADVIVCLGGNGAVVRAMHRLHQLRRPLFPMSLGYRGFLTNAFSTDDLIRRIGDAHPATISPLVVHWVRVDGREGKAIAFNEVALLRQSRRMTSIRIAIENQERLDALLGDGVLVSTPAGSTAYNSSVFGPILPLAARLLAMTPIAPFRPRRWRGALLPNDVIVNLSVNHPNDSPTSLTADFIEVRDVKEVATSLADRGGATLLFDESHSLDERILREQFER